MRASPTGASAAEGLVVGQIRERAAGEQWYEDGGGKEGLRSNYGGGTVGEGQRTAGWNDRPHIP